jgi:glycosyltransferase involved in cell wall biosynthesis
VKPVIWLLQEAEPLPIDDSPRFMRTADLARGLIDVGYEVIWWTSRFNHNLKQFRHPEGARHEVSPGLTLMLLDGPGYPSNMTWQRIRHNRSIAAHFAQLAAGLPQPALVLGSQPSLEFCEAGRLYAHRHGVPFVVDIRDPWPDIFPEYLPSGLRWSIFPLLWHYRRMMRRIAQDASSIVAVSEAMLTWGVRYAGRGRVESDRVFHIGFRGHNDRRVIDVPGKFTPESPLLCLFATTCGVSYNGELLVDAARLLEESGERRIRFIVTGDGERRPIWLERARGLSSIDFTGWIPNETMRTHFRTAHLGLVLLRGGISRFWLGNKIFEYLCASLGVVNNVPGEPEDILRTRGAGANVDAVNPESLAAVLRELVEDPSRVRNMMSAARAAFEKEFDRDVVQIQYVRHLDALARKDARSSDVAA